MSLAKAVVSGTVYRKPEPASTTNNIPVTKFTLNIGENEEILLRVLAFGNVVEDITKNVDKNDKVVVEGKLQAATVKNDDGSERKILEIILSSFEKCSGSANSFSTSVNNSEVVKFAEQEPEIDDLIDEGEIPF